MTILFKIVWVIWLLSEVLLGRLMRSKNEKSAEHDKNSLVIIWVTILVSISMCVLSTVYLDFPIGLGFIPAYTGLVLIMLGMVIRFTAIRSLGKHFTVDLAIRKDHRLIKSGLYSYVRHPSYTGSLLSFLGFGLSLNSWPCIPLALLPVIISFMYRINVEEKMLEKSFGEEYKQYQHETKRLIPWIY
ncbi:MAG: isoprenylcysteine carboxylmethyltransferase family protein [Bacteroidetes bacterium]|nr:isoprenylcysteine carboxylmethyltransferase family protein [Bacteroidota bacterium]